MTRDQMGRVSLIIVSVGICLALGWPAAYTIAQNIFGEAGLNGGPGLTRPDGEAPANDAPSASFTVSIPDSIVADFTDTSTDAQGDSTITSWAWVFGDGTTSTAQSPEKTYDYYGGDRIVNLTVSDERGSQDTAQDTVYVRPGWVIGTLQASTADSLTYTLTGSAAVPSGWEDDIQHYLSVRPISNYETDVFNDTLQVTLPAGLDSVRVWYTPTVDYGGPFFGEVSDFNEQWIPVADPPSGGPENVAPTAAFTTADADGDSLDFEFTDTSTDSDGTIVAWAWDFGDGEISTQQNPTRLYGACGCDRTVTLIVIDNDGAADTTSAAVSVAVPPLGTPTVTSLDGTLSQDETVVIGGSGFGSKSPAAPLLFEDHETGDRSATTSSQFGMDINGVSSEAVVNDFSRGSGTYSTYGNLTGDASAFGYVAWDGGSNHEVWYINYNVYFGSNFNFGTLKNGDPIDTDNNNVKMIRLSGNGGGSDLWVITISSADGRLYVGGGGHDDDNVDGGFSGNIEYEKWWQLEWATELGTRGGDDGTSKVWIDGDLVSNLTGISPLLGGAGTSPDMGFGLAGIGSVTNRYSDDDEFWIDDVYIDNTLARVVVGDNQDYDACTVHEPQIPTAWSDDEITVTFKQNTFSDTDQAWLFVVDSAGTISTGYEIEVGGEGEITAPTITSFAADDTTVTTTQSVDFTATLGGGTPTSYTWRWGDGTSFGTTAAPSHTFSSAGTYDVTLVVSNSAGADSTTKNNYITSSVGNSPPSAALAVTDSASVDAVVLDRSSSTDSDGTIDTTRWTPWSGSWTRVANQDTIVVDYTSQQSTGDVVVEPKVVVVDNDSAADSTTTFYTIPGTGGGGSLLSLDFESGTQPAELEFWESSAVNPTFSISDSTAAEGGHWDSYAGSYHARISGGDGAAAFEILLPDLTGETEVYLELYMIEYADGYQSNNRTYISDDGCSSLGGTFERTDPLEDSTAQTWTRFTVDIDALATSNSMTLGSGMCIRIRTGDMDTHRIIGIDNVTVGTGDPP